MTLGEICAVQLNVVNLGDDELERVAVILDEARVRVRAELGERKRKRRDAARRGAHLVRVLPSRLHSRQDRRAYPRRTSPRVGR